MKTPQNKKQELQQHSFINTSFQKKTENDSQFQLKDNRPEAIQMKRLQEMANTHSNRDASELVDKRPEAIQMKKLQEMANESAKRDALELVDKRPETLQMKRLQEMANRSVDQTIQKKENKTGLPNSLKSGLENLSGHSMDDVKVHYNSNKPAQLQAHAFAQGTDIHLASGQEKHLPHEAWHVVQQKQGRVQPTVQMKGRTPINNDTGLENEADIMGAKASNLSTSSTPALQQVIKPLGNRQVAQRKPYKVQEKGAPPYGWLHELSDWLNNELGSGNWAFTGSFAMYCWAWRLDGIARTPKDVDIVVRKKKVADISFELFGKYESQNDNFYPPGTNAKHSTVNISVKKENETDNVITHLPVKIDILAESKTFGSLSNGDFSDQNFPLLSIEDLIGRKQNIKSELGDSNSKKSNKERNKAERDIILLNNLLQQMT